MKINTDKITLRGERIKLRAFRKTDLDDFYDYAKTPGLGEAAGWFHHKSKEESKEILDTFIKDKNILAIEKDGRVIGSIGIHKYDEEFLKIYLKRRQHSLVLSYRVISRSRE